jgi:hypothetical protein
MQQNHKSVYQALTNSSHKPNQIFEVRAYYSPINPARAPHRFTLADFRVEIRPRGSIDDGHSLKAEALKKRIALVSDNQFRATVNKKLI